MPKYELRLEKEYKHGEETFKAGDVVGIDSDALYKTLTDGAEPIAVDVKKEEELTREAERKRLEAEATARKTEEGRAVVTKVHERSVDAPRWGFKSFGEHAMAVRDAQQGRWDKRLAAAVAEVKSISGMGELMDSDGAFLIAPEDSREVLERVYADENLIAKTDQMPISGNQITMLANAETSRAAGSRWGGVRGYWKSEAAQYTTSKPTFREMKMSPHKLTVMAYVTDELLEDASVALGPYLSKVSGQEISFKVSDALFNGQGSDQPLGILNGPALISVSAESGQATDTIVAENVINMYSRMWAGSLSRAVWYYNQQILPQLMTMTINVGTGGVPVYMPPNGLAAAPYGTLFGRPCVPSEFCSELGLVGDLIFADLGQYLTVTKGGIKTAMSIHLRFDYDETAFKFSFRVDGQPWWNSALTPYKGTAHTLSPFVALATR